MSKECSNCFTDNISSATKCENCGNIFTDAELPVNPTSEKLSYIWKIRCPIDGHEFVVENENSRIETCDFCDDEIDKLEIAKCRPFNVMVDDILPKAVDAINVSTVKEPTVPSMIMTDLESGKVIKINSNCTIGRKGSVETDFFAENMYISEYHCKVFLENGEYKIEHLPTATNPTKINNDALGRGLRKTLRNGDYLKIADKTFEIMFCLDSLRNCDDSDKYEISRIGARVQNAN